MVHVPILRAGRPYRSLETTILGDVRTGEPVAEVSLANRGLIARDLLEAPKFRQTLAGIPAAELITICGKAARSFASDSLPIDEGEEQTPQRYLEQLSGTTGLPLPLCRANMEKIRFVLANMGTVIAGWTRGLDPGVLDAGFGQEEGRRVSFLPQADALGAVLPSNSPGVHSLWIPAFALKYPLVLKPGSREPWTPLRVQRALAAAGAPSDAVSLYPSDHSGAAEILLRCGRSMLFGDGATLRPWKDDPRVQLHGPGWSKVILGRDAAREWPRHLDLMVTSVAENGGRSCLNTSGVWTASHGREIAEALAARLAAIEPRPLADPEAAIAAFPDPAQARRLSHHIDALLETPGADDLTARCRSGGRVVELDGCTFLRPTVIWCDSPDHPLASSEYLFPFVTVVQVDQDEILERIGSTLVATALTDDEAFRRDLMACRHIDRLNLGPIPTSRVSWDQPHEGNLFEHLYRQRALQTAGAA
ncbi:MAG TPA: aldehyde dehydrogenase family protein [Candidatus Polarisedimenticolia bacterium]|nr:aldehyde dehydrogenase family protein [Candidatus Polarisedimenticolia bacterium]